MITTRIHLPVPLCCTLIRRIRETSCHQSVLLPFKAPWPLRQPFIPRQGLRFAVDRKTDLWQIQLLTSLHGESQHACPDGPVNPDTTFHHLSIHFAAFAAVPADNTISGTVRRRW
jgi:hypothetical protein